MKYHRLRSRRGMTEHVDQNVRGWGSSIRLIDFTERRNSTVGGLVKVDFSQWAGAPFRIVIVDEFLAPHSLA